MKINYLKIISAFSGLLILLFSNFLPGYSQIPYIQPGSNLSISPNPSVDDLRYFRLTVNGNGYYSEILVGFDSRSSLGFDDFDAVKFPVTTPSVPDLSALWNDTSYQMMFIPPISQQKISIPLKLKCTTSGNFSFNFQPWTKNIYGSEVFILDKFNNRKINIADSVYSFYFNDSTNKSNRFELQIEPGIGVSAWNNDCSSQNGSLLVRPYNNVEYEYSILNQSMDTLLFAKNVSVANQIHLAPGNYTIAFKKNESGSSIYTESIFIEDIGFVKAESNVETDTIIATNNSVIELIDLSNSSDSYWLINNTIQYANTITYLPETNTENHIFLIANSDVCSDTLDIFIKATDLTTVQPILSSDGFVLKSTSTNSYQLENTIISSTPYSLLIYTQTGQVIKSYNINFNTLQAIDINKETIASGLYYLVISNGSNKAKFNLIFN